MIELPPSPTPSVYGKLPLTVEFMAAAVPHPPCRGRVPRTARILPMSPDFVSDFDYSYSHLKAAVGSMLIALRAGIQLAKRATPVSISEITMKVAGSVALTP